MPRLIYSLLFLLLLPVILIRLFQRGRKAPEYKARIKERFGFFTKPVLHQRPIWVHAVSVGETIAIAPMVKALKQQYPNTPIVMTCTTPTGSQRIKAIFGEGVFHVYAPYDEYTCVKRFYNKINPKLAIFVETEVWPNMVLEAKNRNIPTVLANARMSAKSAKGYAKLSWITRPVFAGLTQVMAQSANDGERLLSLGVKKNRLNVTGSIKFDIEISDSIRTQATELKKAYQGANGNPRPIWIAASTHQGEDALLLQAHKQVLIQHSNALLILVPRHPERFDSVFKLIKEQGFDGVRRTQNQAPLSNQQVLLADTMGEMMCLLGTADIAFVGGSLVPTGGHNMLEPAAWGLPVITGPHRFNFQVISDLLIDANNLVVKETPQAIAEQINTWMNDEALRTSTGQAGRAVVEQNRGALGRQLQALASYLK